MKLDNQLFQSVVAALRSESLDGDKRTTPRVGLTAEVSVTLIKNKRLERPIMIRVRDLSRTGIGFIHTKVIKEGSRLILQLPVPEEKPRYILCEIKHSRPVGSGLYAVGATFLDQDYAQPEECAASAPPVNQTNASAVDRIRRTILD